MNTLIFKKLFKIFYEVKVILSATILIFASCYTDSKKNIDLTENFKFEGSTPIASSWGLNSRRIAIFSSTIDIPTQTGWATGISGLIGTIFKFEGGKFIEYKALGSKFFYAISDSKDHQTGWAVGDKGSILKLENGNWYNYYNDSYKNLHSLNILTASQDQKTGWAFGENGIIVKLDGGKWSDYNDSLYDNFYSLNALSVSENQQVGWAVGEYGAIVKLENGQWSDYSNDKYKNNFSLSAISVCEDQQTGWAVGEKGAIVKLDGGKWSDYNDTSYNNFFKLNALSVSENQQVGWAVGEYGAVVKLEDGKWSKYSNGRYSSSRSLYALSVSEDQQTGWAVGENGVILKLDGGNWSIYVDNSYQNFQSLTALSISKDQKTGCAFGENGVIVKLEGGKWSVSAGNLNNYNMTALSVTKDQQTGWAVGENGVIAKLDGGKWSDYSNDKYKNNFSLRAISVCEDQQTGWAVGEKGAIVKLDGGKWSDYNDTSYDNFFSLNALTVSENQQVGWAVGENEVIVKLERGKWSIYKNRNIKVRSFWDTYQLNALSVSEDQQTGWAVGENGVIVKLDGGNWSDYNDTLYDNFHSLNALSVSENQQVGWAVGKYGAIVKLEDGQWSKYSNSSYNSNMSLYALSVSEDQQTGWAVGENGVILKLDGGNWSIYVDNLYQNFQKLTTLSISQDQKTGWAVGENGVIVKLYGGKWFNYNDDSYNNLFSLTALAVSENQQAGWAVGGHGTIVKLKSWKFDWKVFGSHSFLSDLNDTLYISTSKFKPQTAKISIEEGEITYLKDSARFIIVGNGTDSSKLIFKNIENVKEKLANGKSRLTLTLYGDKGNNLRLSAPIKYYTKPLWQRLWWLMPIGLFFFNFAIIILAPYSSVLRKLIFHPIGQHLIGLVVGKYIFLDFTFHFITPVRLSLFRYFKVKMKFHPLIIKWNDESSYIPVSLNCINNDKPYNWDTYLDELIKQSKGTIHMIIGVSGSGKTALLEKWAGMLLNNNERVIFLRAAEPSGIQEQLTTQLNQFGGFDLKVERAINLVKGGGFHIFIDAINESHNNKEVYNFISNIAINNCVIISSQLIPKDALPSSLTQITLNIRPFGLNQVKDIIKNSGVELELNDKDIEPYKLPFMAIFLKEFIDANKRLPSNQLEIFESRFNQITDQNIVSIFNQKIYNMFLLKDIFFREQNDIPVTFLESMKDSGILTKIDMRYQIRHERIHRFLVGRYLFCHNLDLEAEHRSLTKGESRKYWNDALIFWAEHLYVALLENKINKNDYFNALEKILKFENSIFENIYDLQLTRRFVKEKYKNEVDKLIKLSFKIESDKRQES